MKHTTRRVTTTHHVVTLAASEIRDALMSYVATRLGLSGRLEYRGDPYYQACLTNGQLGGEMLPGSAVQLSLDEIDISAGVSK
jgi:hypothetical protein